MRWLATLAVVAALISPAAAFGQDYTFGDWARGRGFSPGDVMPGEVWADDATIDSLDGISEFDWTTTPTTSLNLEDNSISSIESDDLSGLTNLADLRLDQNQISNIESGAFSGLTNLATLVLDDNQLSTVEAGDFSGLTNLTWLDLGGNQLSSIESGDFTGLTNLTWLDLGGNQLLRLSIEPGAFTGLTNLTSLILAGTRLSRIEPAAFTGLANLAKLHLGRNELTSIEPGAFSSLTNLTELRLGFNQISNIESGAFSDLTNLTYLGLQHNSALTELNLAEADFSSLDKFSVEGNVSITNVSLRNTVVNQMSLVALLNGGVYSSFVGIGELSGITEMDLSGVDFVDITDLEPLYVMDDLTDLWLVDTVNLNGTDLSLLLDNLATIDGTDTEGILYMTETDFDAFNTAGGDLLAAWDAEPGHHVEFLQIGDVNHDTEVNGLDVDPFVDVLLASRFDVAADMNLDGVVNGLDVDPFVAAVVGGGTQSIPEPSTLLLCIVALGVVGGWRKWGG